MEWQPIEIDLGLHSNKKIQGLITQDQGGGVCKKNGTSLNGKVKRSCA
jgi:hypothetical protein